MTRVQIVGKKGEHSGVDVIAFNRADVSSLKVELTCEQAETMVRGIQEAIEFARGVAERKTWVVEGR